MVSITGHTMVLAFSEILRDHNKAERRVAGKNEKKGGRKVDSM